MTEPDLTPDISPAVPSYPETLEAVLAHVPLGSRFEIAPHGWVAILAGLGERPDAPMVVLGFHDQPLYDLLRAAWPRFCPKDATNGERTLGNG